MAGPYDQAFYDAQAEGSLRSARAIVPIVLNKVRVRSVADFGCGQGTWLRAFQENGVDRIRGFDGDYVDRERFQVDHAVFTPVDLTKVVKTDDGPYELAISLEVGEHLPTSRAENLVESLTATAPLVLFSAAIPGQGGTNHINEQWPAFWAQKFLKRGYHKIDGIRPAILGRTDIEWWYRQNVVMYATQAQIDAHESLQADRRATIDSGLEYVADDILANYTSFSYLLGETWRAGLNAVRRRIAPAGQKRA